MLSEQHTVTSKPEDGLLQQYEAAVIVGIGFSGLAVCLIIVCCGVVCLYRFYARTSRHYVGLDNNTTANGTANFLDGHIKRATRSSGPPNYPGSGDVTVDHVTTGNGQYFVLDAEAVNREAMLSSQHRNIVN